MSTCLSLDTSVALCKFWYVGVAKSRPYEALRVSRVVHSTFVRAVRTSRDSDIYCYSHSRRPYCQGTFNVLYHMNMWRAHGPGIGLFCGGEPNEFGPGGLFGLKSGGAEWIWWRTIIITLRRILTVAVINVVANPALVLENKWWAMLLTVYHLLYPFDWEDWMNGSMKAERKDSTTKRMKPIVV